MCSLLIAFALLLGVVPTASAATAPTPGGNGLRVSPVRTDLIISPGETKVVTINVTNVTSAPGTFQTVVNDFVADPNESGNPAIIFNSTEFAPTHSLKRYVGPVTRFTLAPGQQQGIPITIKVPANAAGGGYYGAIRFAPAGASLSRKQQVNLAGSVGSLILVKVPGNITNKLAIASFDARTRDRASSFFTSSKNIDATVRFQNQGNIQEQPFGKVLLRDRSGKILNSFEINATNPPGNVLPDSIRKFSIPVNKVGKFGKFKLEGNFGYGTSGQLLSGSTTFYVIPSWMILTFVGVVLFLVFLIFGVPRLVRAYNQRVLRRAGRR
ncbi:MAG: hypothetical protein JWO35_274 [Candidatus Saccharibacteria bacterium]|nr:hypothetical protein [Candidatus Saccharibacteria bacterium]